MDILSRLNWIDGAILLIAFVSVVLAVRRGGVFEIILLSGLLAAFLGGYWVCEWAVFMLKDSGLWVWAIKLVSFPLSFLIIYMMFSSIGHGVDSALHAVKFDSAWLDIGDRLFGIALGLMRSFLFICLLYLGVLSLYGSDIPASVRSAYSLPFVERAMVASEDFYHQPGGIMNRLRVWVEQIRPPQEIILEEDSDSVIDDVEISFRSGFVPPHNIGMDRGVA